MYVTTVDYEVRPDACREACRLWTETVVEAARERPGFIKLELLSREGHLLAIASWEHRDFARAFLETGIFQTLTERLKPYLLRDPLPQEWHPEVFLER